MENKYEVVKFVDNDFELDVKADINNETVWLTQEEMALLFNVDRTRIVRHINNIYLEGELSKDSTCAENAHMGTLGVQNYRVKMMEQKQGSNKAEPLAFLSFLRRALFNPSRRGRSPGRPPSCP